MRRVLKASNNLVYQDGCALLMKTFITNSEQETIDLGCSIGISASKGDIVLLFGGLGSGKTVISKGIAKGLGVEAYVTSPTFTIMQVYQGRLNMYHFDLYRLNNTDEMADLGYEEFIYSDDGVAVVEWAERLQELLPESYLRIDINSLSDSMRKITIKSIGNDHDDLEDML